MIQFILGWLWDFNHKHEWEHKEVLTSHTLGLGVRFESEVAVYTCKCGEIKRIEL